MRRSRILAFLIVGLLTGQVTASAAPQGAVGGSSKNNGGSGGSNSGPGDVVPGRTVDAPAPHAGATAPTKPLPSNRPVATPSQPRGATTAREVLAEQDPTSWDLWWRHNDEPYLALHQALERIHPRTEGDRAALMLHERRAGVSWQDLYGKAVPAMLSILESSRDQRVVRAALLALARVGESPWIGDAEAFLPLLPVLDSYLTSQDETVAETAVIALGVLGTPEALRQLADLLRDTREGRKLAGEERVPLRTRALAAYGLGIGASYLQRSETTHFAAWNLCEALRSAASSQADLQVACVAALGLIPLESRGFAGSAYEDRPSRSLQEELAFLSSFFLDQDTPDLVRSHVPTAIAHLLPSAERAERERAMRQWIEALEHDSSESSEVRSGCMLALGATADCDGDTLDSEARRVLDEVAAGHDAMERCFALLALGQISGRAGEWADNAYESLAETGARLCQTLIEGKSRMGPWAALSLGLAGHGLRGRERTPPPAFASSLADRLRDTNVPEDAAAYAIAAGLLGDGGLQAALESDLVRFRDDHWRARIAIGLGLLGQRGAIEPLQRVFSESWQRPELMEASAIARALLGDTTLVPELVRRLPQATSMTEIEGLTRSMARTADGRALEPLLALLTSSQSHGAEQALALTALGWIGDKESIVWEARISCGINYVANTPTLSDPWGLGILDTL